MALIACKECGKQVSNDAAICPHCGKKLRMGLFAKVAVGVAAVFVAIIIYGLSIPENVAKANAARRVCEKELVPSGAATAYDCEREYDRIKAGR
jgi:hypothetical protein